MLYGRLGFCFGIVDGPLGGGIRLEGTWREGKVSKQKDTGEPIAALDWLVQFTMSIIPGLLRSEDLAW